jgi:hypothetical protein
MASWKYTKDSNLGTVTLGSSYTAASGSMSLTSGHGARLPSSGDFWLAHNNGSGTIRIFKVTARSTDTLTVTAVTSEGAGDGNLSSGETLRPVISVDALDQLKRDAGSLVLLETQTASSSAQLDFTASITSTYDDYIFKLVNIIPATDGTTILMRMSTDGGSSYASTSYTNWQVRFDSGSSGVGGSATNAVALAEGNGIGNASAFGLVGTVELFAPGSSSVHKAVEGSVVFRSAAGTRIKHTFGGAYESNTAVNAVRFLAASGNITSGIIRCYGVAK